MSRYSLKEIKSFQREGRGEYISPRKTDAILKKCKARLVATPDDWYPDQTVDELEIYIRKKWVPFGTTSLIDDVATGRFDPPEDWHKSFIGENMGARLTEYGFHVIDSLSDG